MEVNMEIIWKTFLYQKVQPGETVLLGLTINQTITEIENFESLIPSTTPTGRLFSSQTWFLE